VTARLTLLDGMRRVWRSPAVLGCVFLITLLTALPFSLALRAALQASLGSSLAADEALRAVNYRWWTEFAAAQTAGPWRTFVPSIIGFAVVLDNVSALLDRLERPASIVALGAAYLLLWLFLAGGILDRYARNRPTRVHEFFGACGIYFLRFLRLAPLVLAAYWLLFRVVHPWLFGSLYQRAIHDLTSERTAFAWRLVFYVIFGACLLVVNVIVDYAKVRAVVEDRHSMIGSIAASMRFVRRNARTVAALYALNGLLFVGLLGAYALLAPGSAGGASIWIGFLLSQVYIAARLWIKLVFMASETSLFQQRLAYPGYVAAPAPALPEPPIVEQLIGQ